jgi:hypothetical protein
MRRLPQKAPIFLLALSGLVAAAQTADTIPRLTNGKPDFNGVWQRPYVPDMATSSRDGSQIGPGTLPFTPEYAKKLKKSIDDSKAFTKLWKNTRVFTLRPDWEIMEYSREENNKDFNEGHIK